MTSSCSGWSWPADPGRDRLPGDRHPGRRRERLLWGGLVRVFFVHHVTFSINSVCHFLGTRRFEVDDTRPTSSGCAPSMGEAWHHNHHAFPRSANHGLKKWELDPSAWVITAMERPDSPETSSASPRTPGTEAMKSHGSEPSTQAGPGSVYRLPDPKRRQPPDRTPSSRHLGASARRTGLIGSGGNVLLGPGALTRACLRAILPRSGGTSSSRSPRVAQVHAAFVDQVPS